VGTPGHSCSQHSSAIAGPPPLSEDHSMSEERMNQISRELRNLYAELQSLQTRALPCVEEFDNDFYDAPLPSEVHEMFRTLQRLITKV
jgi:hypothetical protein